MLIYSHIEHYNINSEVSRLDAFQWKFDHYSSSPWELSWFNNISILQDKVCETLLKPNEIKRSIQALTSIIQFHKEIFHQYLESNKYDELFSKICYRSPLNQVVCQYIEPLIGLLRDPLTICKYDNIPSVLQIDKEAAMQSKRFFLLGPSAPYQNYQTPTKVIAPWLYRQGSQKILFDIGCSLFAGTTNETGSSSLTGARWFYEYFRSHSLHFDRIIAFDRADYSPRVYWKQIPADLMGILTYIAVGVESTGKYNPWNILKTIAKHDDYVLIKLDIDTPTLEMELIGQLIKNVSISSLIDEMFFEMHVTVEEMKPYWTEPPGKLKDTYKLFKQLRQMGIRMHSWP
ncbi:unnamed protein product [Adineta ricciae]|uniref:Uncharacterized protein n=1 Tax=Adineta ricciae TaxID=249248 RepID=A0A814RAE1_ADIRI|nr:unnamed protein product [Adineta ricciae]